MEKKLRNIIKKEIFETKNQDFATKICDEYLEYYFNKSISTKEQLRKLLDKYNEKTIFSFTGKNGSKNDYLHLALGHNMGEKTLIPMLENGGDVFPPDREIGQIIKDPEYWSKDETDDEWEIREKFHGYIFFAWFSTIWIEIKGYKSQIVVKISNNDNLTSWYLNDFKFDSNSNFFLDNDWKSAIKKHNKKAIELEQLLENIKHEYGR
ncbi:hypothetical protein [Psychroserpens sp. NJDZ02]|uniref:hypothetical protein n=1 Tax=Psychroserpens sp. NJDZ02 TaxID=2570561 RepID=UPI0010A76E58|nr:hypothetical protein [Psychroserpens sp. NJDZ02]QCE42760.1 hypothetical protein E9099_15530 [Psychroserpens sp. NJDZ02]